jgi:hypothetical protein
MRRLLFITLVLSGCVHVSKDVLVDRSSAPVPQEDVQVYFVGDELPERCEPVAYLHASADVNFGDQEKVVSKFTKEAGELGANAVVIRESYGSSRRSASVLDSPSANEYDAEAFWCGGAGGPGDAPGR